MATTSINGQGIGDTLISCQSIAAADVDTDTNGDITITFPDLLVVNDAILQIAGGYSATCTSVSLNTATFRVFDQDGTTTGQAVLSAVASGTDLGAAKATAFGTR